MTDAVFPLSTVDLPCLQRTPDCQRGNTVRLLSANMQHTDIAVADVVISVVLGNDDTVAVTEFSPCRLFRRQRVDFVLQARVERLYLKAGFCPHRREDLNALARPITPRSLLAQKVGNGAVIRGKQAEAVIPPQFVLPVQLREVHDILTQRRGIRALTVLLLQADRRDAERQKVGEDVSCPDGQQLIRVAEQGNAAIPANTVEDAGEHLQGHHRRLIDDDQSDAVPRNGIQKVCIWAFPKRAVDRACLDPGALGEVARSLAGRGGDHIRHKSVIALSEAMHDGFNERGLAAARAAENNGEAAVQRQLDRLALLFAEENVTGAELPRDLHDRQSRGFKDVSEPLRRSHLICRNSNAGTMSRQSKTAVRTD